MSLIIGIGSESAKIKSRKLSRRSFRKNFTPRNFLAIRYNDILAANFENRHRCLISWFYGILTTCGEMCKLQVVLAAIQLYSAQSGVLLGETACLQTYTIPLFLLMVNQKQLTQQMSSKLKFSVDLIQWCDRTEEFEQKAWFMQLATYTQLRELIL